MKKLLLSLIGLCFIGCATPDYNYTPLSMEISEPPLENVNTSYVGDVMLRQGKYTEHDSIYVTEKIDAGIMYDILPGYYLKKGEDKKTETYMPSGGEDSGDVDKALLADPWAAVMAYKDEPKICVITVFNAVACKATTKFNREKKQIVTKDSFQQTLIYSGKVGDKINIAYREYSNDVARPAFNNDVEYDLSASSTIGYKGARLEIIEATNEYIKYRVLSNFNNASI